MGMTVRELGHEDLKPDFVQTFAHEQVYGRVWKKRDGRWRLEEVETPTVRSWDAEKRLWVPEYLEAIRSSGGCVLGCFAEDVAAEEKLLDNPQLFRTPIVRNGKLVTTGYHPEVWETWE